MLVGQLVETTLQLVGDPEGNRYGVGQVLALLNEGQRELMRQAGIKLRGITTIGPDPEATPPTGVFTLPSDFHEVESLTLIGQTRPVLPLLLEDALMLADGDLLGATGEPQGFLAGYDPNALRLIPAPADVRNATLAYVRRPVDLAQADEPEGPDLYHMALAHFAAAWILVHDQDLADEAKATIQKAAFDAIVVSAKGTAARRGVATHRSIPRRGIR